MNLIGRLTTCLIASHNLWLAKDQASMTHIGSVLQGPLLLFGLGSYPFEIFHFLYTRGGPEILMIV